MAASRSSRRSRKPRGAGTAPRAVPSPRRHERGVRDDRKRAQSTAQSHMLGTYGEPPKGIFGGIPVAEIAIFVGLIGTVVGIIEGGGAALIIGIVVCALGVLEVTVREHFSGYRSHSTLLAAAPAVVVEVLIAEFIGVPTNRTLLLLPVFPIFGIAFWVLRRAFQAARHTRVARSSSP